MHQLWLHSAFVVTTCDRMPGDDGDFHLMTRWKQLQWVMCALVVKRLQTRVKNMYVMAVLTSNYFCIFHFVCDGINGTQKTEFMGLLKMSPIGWANMYIPQFFFLVKCTFSPQSDAFPSHLWDFNLICNDSSCQNLLASGQISVEFKSRLWKGHCTMLILTWFRCVFTIFNVRLGSLSFGYPKCETISY